MSDSESWTSGLINEQLRKRFENHDTAKVTNLANQSCIAANMPPKTNIVFEGKAGDNFGGFNQGSKIVLNGDAGRFVGNGMNKGEIIINGNCEDGAGHSMFGGKIVIQGSVDGDAGASMYGGDLLVSGSVRGDLATCMNQGNIIICGDVLGDIGRMMDNGKIFIAGDFDENDNINTKNISPSDWKKLKIELKDNGIDSKDLDFKAISSKKLTKKQKNPKPDYKSLNEDIILVPASLTRRPRTPGLDEVDLSLTIGTKKEKPLNLTIPLLWQGDNAPSYFIWKINEKINEDINNANIAIIDLTATNINRRLDMKKPTDLTVIVDLLNQSSANRVPILVRIYAGDVDNDLGVIAKSGADGVILVSDKIPIEAALVSSRNYKEQMIILAETDNLDYNNSTKLLALGSSGIFLQNKCGGNELKEFGTNLSKTVGSLGVGKTSDLSSEHLRATSQKVASMTGIAIAGYNSVLPMWRH
jgi:glutamate synthase domain-containing protein 3